MKKVFYSALAFAVIALASCKDKDEDVAPLIVDPVSNVVVLTGNLSTQTLDASKVYLIQGQVFVNDGATLTIPAGTVLKGQKSSKGTLVVKPGAKLVAEGTSASPIVFTSDREAGARDKGDWGGIILLGKAAVNSATATTLPSIEGISPAVEYGKHGASVENADNSGTLKYVRIEYAGIAISPNNETNTLTMAGVGSGTTIENVQASFGGDDAFEWFGGTVNCKNLISLATWDDDFDCDFGFTGKVQHAIAIRDPFAADQSASNGFEVDNDGSGSGATPQTAPVFSNVTIFGPKTDSNTTISSNYGHALHIRRNSAISIFNSVFVGYTKGLLLETANNTFTNYSGGTGVLANNVIAATKVGNSQPSMFSTSDAGASAYWSSNGNKLDTIYTNASKVSKWSDVGLRENIFFSENSAYPANPDLTSVAATGSLMPTASFSNAKLTSTFFTTTTYVGAFGTSTDWTDGWSNFNPQTVAY